MHIGVGRLSRTITRAHVEGALAGGLLVAAVVGACASSWIDAKAQDLRWLGRRLVEKRQLVEHQRTEFARLVADMERAVASLEEMADDIGEVVDVGAADDAARYELAAVAYGDEFLTPRSDVAEMLGRLAAVEGRLVMLGKVAAFAGSRGDLGGMAVTSVPTGWPVSGRLTSEFGMRVAPIRGGWRMHPGLDISAPTGTRVRAAGSGRVLSSGYRSGYGNTVVIDHGDGLQSLYGHMSRLAAAKGRPIRQGDLVGYVGNTGHATGAHLHFEVRLRGEPVDPLCFLSGPSRHRGATDALTTPG